MQQSGKKTLKEKVECAKLKKIVKKCRTRARRKGKELIQETLEAQKGPRQVNKHRNKQMIISMMKESREITSDREGILKTMHRFSANHSVPKQCPHWKVQGNQIRHRRNILVLQKK